MPEQIINLGLPVNQDLPPTRLDKNVYDSQNFRISTDEGGTFTVRTNVKGNTAILDIPCTGNIVKIDPPNEVLFEGTPIAFGLDLIVGGIASGSYTFSFIYTTPLNYILEIYNQLITNTNVKVALNRDAPYLTIQGLTGVETVSVTIPSGSIASYTDYPLPNSEFQKETLPGVFVSDSTNWGITGNSPILYNTTGGGFSGTPVTFAGFFSTTNLNLTTSLLTTPYTPSLPPGDYLISIKYGFYISTGGYAVGSTYPNATITVKIGGVTVGTFNPRHCAASNSFERVSTFTASLLGGGNLIEIIYTQTNAGVVRTIYHGIDRVILKRLTETAPIVANNYIEPECNLKIIGWTALRDDIYLLTTNEIREPEDFTSSKGQIWKLTYDKSQPLNQSSNYQLTLKYNNTLNFTAARPIANPGGIEIRYESPAIQKIYWTDNFNRPRVANVGDPDLASKNPDELNLVSAIDFDIPIITEITNGNLNTGMVQFVYRLLRSNGVESRFSLPSKSVFINNQVASTTFWQTQAGDIDVQSGKAVKFKIDNIDTTFDKIQIAAVQYGVTGSIPTVNLFYEEKINDRTTIEGLFDGNETLIPITLDELTAFAPNILRCKSIASHRNTLFFTNVILGKFDINFDTRTYRFPFGLNTTHIFHQGVAYELRYDSTTGLYEYLNPIDGTYNLVPEDWDAVQPYDDSVTNFDQSPYKGDGAFLYTPNASDHILNLGGSGPNINYEFVSKDILEDEGDIGNVFTPNANPGGLTAPYKNVGSLTTIDIDTFDHIHPHKNYYETTISPYMFPLLAGYQRDEMYRTGIVFYDKFGNESFVKWIGDIRIPHVYMPNGPTKNNRTLSFPLVEYRSNKAYTKQTYIKFNVNVANLPSDVRAFSIVVAPRTEENKRVLGQGILEPGYKADALGGDQDASGTGQDGRFVFTTSGARNQSGNNGYSTNSGPNDDGSYGASNKDVRNWHFFMNMKSPEFLFNGFPGYQTEDHFDIVALLDVSQQGYQKQSRTDGVADGDIQTAGGGAAGFGGVSSGVFKHYSHSFTPPLSITDSNSAILYNVLEAKTLARFNDSGLGERQTFSILQANWPTFSGTQFTSGGFVVNCSPPSASGVSNTVDGSSIGIPSVGIVYGRTNTSTYNDFLSQSFLSGGLGFLRYDGWATTGNKVYIGNYKRSLNKQYGGNSFSERSNTEYRYADNFTLINPGDITKQVLLVSGDTYTTVYDHYNQAADYERLMARSSLGDTIGVGIDDDKKISLPRVYCTPMECTLNLNLKKNRTANRESLLGNQADLNGIECPNIEAYDKGEADLFSWRPNYKVFFPKPFDYLEVEQYDCRTYKSDPKIDNEEVDSWSTIKPQAYLDVDTKYGPINNLIVFRNGLYYFQDRAFGKFQVAEQKLLSDSGGNSDLILGSAGILERYDYISNTTGSKHQFSFGVSDYTILWYDTLNRKLYRFTGQDLAPLSDVKGYSAFLYNRLGGRLQNSDNPYLGRGVHATYDFRFNEFLITFVDRNSTALGEDNNNIIQAFTLVYNEMLDAFIGRYTHHPKVYINDKSNIFSPYITGAINPYATAETEDLYIHNQGLYGVFYNDAPAQSIISFPISANAAGEKVLNNLEIVAEGYYTYDQGSLSRYTNPLYNDRSRIAYQDFFDQIRVYDSYQNSGYRNLDTLSRKHKTLWNIKVPSDYTIDTLRNIFDPSNLYGTPNNPPRPKLTRRFKDKWFIVDLIYNNTVDTAVVDGIDYEVNNKFVVQTAKAIYSVNSR